jgi:hypothetical protein
VVVRVPRLACARSHRPHLLPLPSRAVFVQTTGYSGSPSQALLDSLAIIRYQSSKTALAFADYSSSAGSRLGVADLQQLLASSSSSSDKGSGRLRLAFASN